MRTLIDPNLETVMNRHKSSIEYWADKAELEVRDVDTIGIQRQLSNIERAIGSRDGSRETRPSRVIQIPHVRNPKFFGRADILDQIKSVLAGDESDRRQHVCVIHGASGVGKTHIALEYTYATIQIYKIVIWVLSDDISKIHKSFVEAAKSLGIPRSTESPSFPEAVEFVRAVLTESS